MRGEVVLLGTGFCAASARVPWGFPSVTGDDLRPGTSVNGRVPMRDVTLQMKIRHMQIGVGPSSLQLVGGLSLKKRAEEGSLLPLSPNQVNLILSSCPLGASHCPLLIPQLPA